LVYRTNHVDDSDVLAALRAIKPRSQWRGADALQARLRPHRLDGGDVPRGGSRMDKEER
jgi:hypothetical protein